MGWVERSGKAFPRGQTLKEGRVCPAKGHIIDRHSSGRGPEAWRHAHCREVWWVTEKWLE